MWADQARRSLVALQQDSIAGNGESSYWAYRTLADTGRVAEAREFLERAKAQGHPVAKQKWACLAIIARFGVKRIPEGIILYFANIPALVRYTKENVR